MEDPRDTLKRVMGGVENADMRKIELTDKLIDNLIGDDHPHIRDLKTSIFTNEDLSTWQLTLLLLDTFFIEPFILEEDKRANAKFLLRKIYNSRISLEGRGRDDIQRFGGNYIFNLNEDKLKKQMEI